MTDPADNSAKRDRTKWLWLALIALFALLLVLWLINPAGDPEDSVFEPETPDVEVGAEAALPDDGSDILEQQADPAVPDGSVPAPPSD